jgi:hypothetical protein
MPDRKKQMHRQLQLPPLAKDRSHNHHHRPLMLLVVLVFMDTSGLLRDDLPLPMWLLLRPSTSCCKCKCKGA